MNITREQLKLYAVTDRSWLGSETLYEQVEKALKGGVTLVQLREKTLDEAAFEKEGQELLELCHHYNVPLIINDNVEIAGKIQADGVHLGQEDGDPRAAYGVLDEDSMVYYQRRVEYDVAEAQRRILAAGLPDMLARRLGEGM